MASVALMELSLHVDSLGDLVVMESHTEVPFAIARVFTVRAAPGLTRGQHAHKACAQFLSCPNGCIEVRCDDGQTTGTFRLDRPNMGLLVPPGIWAEEIFVAPGSVLMVLCDRPFEEEDYIRDYAEFKAYAPRTSHQEQQ